jgi:hypothetical protein
LLQRTTQHTQKSIFGASSQKEKHIREENKMIMPCTKEVVGSFVKKELLEASTALRIVEVLLNRKS